MKKLMIGTLLLLGGSFQASANVNEFSRQMDSLDLNAPGYKLKYKDGGTSVGLKVKYNGEKIGKWLPDNSATNVEAQVVSYQLAEVMGMPGLVVPSDYYVLKGESFDQFKMMLESAQESNKWRLINRNDVLSLMKKQPQGLLGVFTSNIECAEVRGLANDEANTINRSHVIAQFIRADGPMPDMRPLRLSGPRGANGRPAEAPALQLAQEFSRIMVLDVLTGQWDRWSGGNVEAAVDPETQQVHFLARDNGGASMKGRGHAAKYFGIVTRFDRFQIESIVALRNEIVKDPQGVALRLKMKSDIQSLRGRIEALLEHVEEQVRTYGARRAYFPEPT